MKGLCKVCYQYHHKVNNSKSETRMTVSKSSRVESSRVESSQVKSSQVKSSQVKSSQVKSRMTVSVLRQDLRT